MSKIKIFFVTGIFILIAGCYIQSLNPLYDKESLTFDSELVGTWYSTEDDDAVWIFEKARENEYILTGRFSEDKSIREAKFEAFLVQLNDFLYLDIYPKEMEAIPDVYREHLIPVHTFLKLHREGDVLMTQSLNYDLLKEIMSQEKATIAHINLDNRLLITAPTEVLQKFFIEYAQRENIFQTPDTLYRKK